MPLRGALVIEMFRLQAYDNDATPHIVAFRQVHQAIFEATLLIVIPH
jgi:hypothetical protein